MIVAGAQSEFDKRARVGYRLRLPSVIALVTPHGVFTGLVPRPSRFAVKVVLSDKRFLNRLRSLGINFLLASRTCRLLLPRVGMLSLG